MISSPDIALWICASVLSGFVAFLVVARGQFRRFSALAIYFAIVTVVGLVRMLALYAYGFTSREYAYCYYFSDLPLTLVLYFVIASLYRKVFPSSKAQLHVRIGSIMIAAAVGVFSFVIAEESFSRVLFRWILEYGQELSFVGMLAAVSLLGFAAFKATVPKPIRQLTFVFAGYYFFFLLMYVIRNFIPNWWAFGEFAPVFGVWLPLGVAYVFCETDIDNFTDQPYLQL